MTSKDAIAPEIRSLIEAVCDGVADDAQVSDLRSLLHDNDEVCSYYVDLLNFDAELQWLIGSQSEGNSALKEIAAAKQTLPLQPAPTCLLGTSHNMIGYLDSGWPVAYLIAAVIFGVGALIGTFTYVSQPVQVAKQPVSLPSPLSPLHSVVGQITGMVDCKWNGASLHSSKVCLGDKYDLVSGLMEITYHTGAKVILQGPATYVVDAKNGGSINIGRLTGIVEVANAKGFTLRTPTAIVTDLGTEFGVEVDKEGSTTSHVFRGAVDLRPIHRDKNADAAGIILRANESAQTERDSGADHSITVHRVAVNSDVFVRRLDKLSSSVDVLAWFRMGEDEPNARAGEPVSKEIHSHNKTRVRLERHSSPTYNADTEAPGSTLAMTFRGGSDGEYVSSPRFALVPNDYFILEAWVKLHKLGPEKQVIVLSGQGPQNGYCLTVENGRWTGVFGGVGWIDSGVACEIDQWTHLALVCERGKARLWMNGQPVGRGLDAVPNMPDGPFTIGGQIGHPECTFNGEIDEVRLSTFVAPFRPEMTLFRKVDRSQ